MNFVPIIAVLTYSISFVWFGIWMVKASKVPYKKEVGLFQRNMLKEVQYMAIGLAPIALMILLSIIAVSLN